MLTMRTTQRGMTLIELMIALAVAGVLFGLAMPTFRAWIQNSQIRTAADAVINGIQLARSEAIRRNKPVEFILRTGADWSVVQVTPRQTVQERLGHAGSQHATVNVSPGGTDRITFNPMGAPAGANQNGSLPIQQVDVTTDVAGLTGVRPLRIVISVSGGVRMCDPDPNLPAGDPRRCNL